MDKDAIPPNETRYPLENRGYRVEGLRSEFRVIKVGLLLNNLPSVLYWDTHAKSKFICLLHYWNAFVGDSPAIAEPRRMIVHPDDFSFVSGYPDIGGLYG